MENAQIQTLMFFFNWVSFGFSVLKIEFMCCFSENKVSVDVIPAGKGSVLPSSIGSLYSYIKNVVQGDKGKRSTSARHDF